MLLSQPDNLVEDINQEASVNLESTKKTSNDRGTKNNSNGLFVGSQKSSKSQSKDDEDKERNSRKLKSDREIMRILNTDSRFHFKVLSLNNLHNAPKVPSTYRKLALIVHPNKNEHPKAGEAFSSI